jgi:hypothetical protein
MREIVRRRSMYFALVALLSNVMIDRDLEGRMRLRASRHVDPQLELVDRSGGRRR